MSEHVDWRRDLKVDQPTFQEPDWMKEVRVLKMLDAYISVNSDFIEPKTAKKLQKAINVRSLTLFNEHRDAETL